MPASVHVKRRLTDLSVHFPWEFESIGEEFFPRRPVDFLTDQFVSFNKANLLQLEEASPLGDDDTPPDVEIKLDADKTFSCKVFGLNSPGKWITERNADPSVDYETERTIQLTSALRLRLEYLRVVQKLRSTSVMTNNSTLPAGSRFDNYGSATSKPITTMQFIVDTVGYANNGRKPNKIGMTTLTLRAVARSEEFKDLVKFTYRQDAQGMQLGALRGIIEESIGVVPGAIKISDAVYNVAASSQTPIYTTFMGPDIVFGYVEPYSLRSFSMSAGFQWSAFSNDPYAIISVPRYHNTMIPVEDLRAFCVIDPNVVVPELGYLLKGAISTTQDSDGRSYGNLVAY